MINIPYTTAQDVLDLTGITDLTIAQISGILTYAFAQLNGDIQIKWSDERVGYLNSEKQNLIDSSNKTFYTKYFPIGDADNNGIISGVDVYCYTIDSLGVRADILVSGITNSGTGKIELTSAPAPEKELYLTYYSSPINMETPHSLVKLAATQLASALSYTRINAGEVQSFRVGKIGVVNNANSAYKIYRQMYYDTINRIRSEIYKVLSYTNRV